MKKALLTTLALTASALTASAITLYSNGFETDIAGWSTPTRVASGTGNITSADGAFHATTAAGAGDYTRWGGYNFGAGGVATAFQDYTTSVDIFLNLSAGWANDTRFDFNSAINNDLGTHLRDFIFNAGFYNDTDSSPGSGTNRFVISASNNSQPKDAYAKNPGRDPIAISTTGWYTFEHHFYDDGGILAVDMSIIDSSNTLVNTWTISTTDSISATGGNRYGWFDYNQFSTLAFDNAELHTNPASVPDGGTTLVLLGGALTGLGVLRRKIRK
jgi:hypothetical protein